MNGEAFFPGCPGEPVTGIRNDGRARVGDKCQVLASGQAFEHLRFLLLFIMIVEARDAAYAHPEFPAELQ